MGSSAVTRESKEAAALDKSIRLDENQACHPASFQTLPQEIRDKIWSFLHEGASGRIFHGKLVPRSSGVKLAFYRLKQDALSQICFDLRLSYIQNGSMFLGGHNNIPGSGWWFVPERDTLYIDAELYSSMFENNNQLSKSSTGLDEVKNLSISYALVKHHGNKRELICSLLSRMPRVTNIALFKPQNSQYTWMGEELAIYKTLRPYVERGTPSATVSSLQKAVKLSLFDAEVQQWNFRRIPSNEERSI